MPRKRYKAEEIDSKLRLVDVLTSRGRSADDAIRQIDVTEMNYYWWRCAPDAPYEDSECQ
jgi:hypothetical protein